MWALCTVMRERRASSLKETSGVARMWPSRPYLRVVRPSGLSASAKAASHTRLTVSRATVGLNGGFSGMAAG